MKKSQSQISLKSSKELNRSKTKKVRRVVRKKPSKRLVVKKREPIEKDKSQDVLKDNLGSLINTVKSNDQVVKLSKNLSGKKKSNTKEKSSSDSNLYTVEFTNVKEIKDGIIITGDSRYIKILEIFPVNYWQKNDWEREQVISDFQRLFAIVPSKFMFKTVTNKEDVRPIISNIEKQNKNERNQKVLRAKDNYIRQINSIEDSAGVETRYFFIYEYEKTREEGTKDDFATVLSTMNGIEASVRSAFRACGNEVYSPAPGRESEFQLTVLYEYFNKKDAISETVFDRIKRLQDDEIKYNERCKKRKHYVVADYISPRGIDTTNKDVICVDGTWYTYLTIKDNGYPPVLFGGWLDMYSSGVAGIDVTVSCQKQPKSLVQSFLSRKIVWDKSSRGGRFQSRDKQMRLEETISNNALIEQGLNSGEEYFRVVTTITIWGDNPKGLYNARNFLIRQFRQNQMYVERAEYDIPQYFANTSPLLTFDASIFLRNGHDMLSSSLATMYNFTRFMLFDDNGIVLGTNTNNNSMAVLNNFNTKKYKNGNISIVGTTGAGKSFTEMLFSERSRLTGFNNYLILPVKGHEYRRMCLNIGGEYIPLFPGSEYCINIMAIYPEGEFREDDLDDEVVVGENVSLLTKKIKSLITWLQLRLGNYEIKTTERSLLSKLITEVYSDYGITNDNNSIYDKDGSLKVMPTIKTLYDKASDQSETFGYVKEILEDFVNGQYRNFVGQTNVDLSNRFIVFDVNERLIDAADLASIIYIAFDCAYNIVTSNNYFSNIILDEVWKMMKNKDCAEQVQSMSKLIRGYGGALVTATQEINDLVSNPYGASVINNAKIKIVMQLEKDQYNKVAEVVGLTREDMSAVLAFERGSGMFIANGLHIPIKFQASDYEYNLFTTDPNDTKKLKTKV